MALSLAGKTAIVTGAGSGINLCFARALLAKRCNVVFADLSLRPEAEALVAAHQNISQAPARAVFQETDVREWRQLERMFEVAGREFREEKEGGKGGVDLVCPGAGVYEPPFSSFWYPPSTPSSRDQRTSSRYASLDINLTHPIRVTQLALAHFLSHSQSHSPHSHNQPQQQPPLKKKAVIHISSIAGQVTPLAAPIYNATKHGLNGFIRTLGPLDHDRGDVDMGVRVRVTGVAPGVIKTPLWTEHPEKLRLVQEGTDAWVSPEYVADTMVEMVEREEILVSASGAGAGEKKITGLSTGDARQGERMVKVQGGMIVEIAKGRRRVVEQFLDPGPSGEGNTVSGMGKAEQEIWDMLKDGWGRSA